MPVLSTQQKAIIRQIAKEQIKSFLRIVEQKSFEKVKQEMLEEGYEVNDMDFFEYFAEQLELWEELVDSPEAFLKRLDDINLSVLKHDLVNEFGVTEHTRGIWRRLNLYDKLKLYELKQICN